MEMRKGQYAALNGKFCVGTQVEFNETIYYLAKVTFCDRPPSHRAGESSPEWIQQLNVSTTIPRGRKVSYAASCTRATKECELFIDGKPGGIVEVLATEEKLNWAAKDGRDIVEVLKLKVQSKPFDPSPSLAAQTRDAQAWRSVSAFCEEMLSLIHI